MEIEVGYNILCLRRREIIDVLMKRVFMPTQKENGNGDRGCDELKCLMKIIFMPTQKEKGK